VPEKFDLYTLYACLWRLAKKMTIKRQNYVFLRETAATDPK